MNPNRSWLVTALLACALIAGQASTASAIEEAARTTQAGAEVAFTYGVRAYNHAEYQKALAHLEEAVRLDPGDGTARYWLGLTRMKLDDPRGAAADIEAAMKAERPAQFDRGRLLTDLGAAQLQAGDAAAAEKSLAEALNLRPGDSTALYLHGAALARVGKTDEGRRQAERARASDSSLPSIPEQSIAPGKGAELVGSGQLPFFEIRLGVEYLDDSNPGILPDDVVAFDPESDPNDPERIDGGDQAGIADLRVEIHPFYGAAGWSMGLRLDAYQSLHQDFDLFDLGEGRGVVQLAWGKDPLGYVTGPMGYTRVPAGDSRASVLIQAGTSYSYLEGESYNRTHEGAASLTLREGPRTATQLDYDYQDLDFFDNPDVIFGAHFLSGHESSFKASQYLFLGRRDRYLRFGARAGDTRHTEPSLNTSFREGSLELALPRHRRVILHVAGDGRQDDYGEPVGDPREDKTVNLSAAVAWAFSDHFYLTARGGYIKRSVDPVLFDSLFEYDRTIASIGVTWYY